MISENRASHLAHLIREELLATKYIESSDQMQVLQKVKKGLDTFIKTHNEVDRSARALITNQKKNLMEGSMEWEIMYGRFYEQELVRKGV